MPMGSFQHNIDGKGRLFIPKKLRGSLGESFIVAKSIDGQPCLCVYTHEEWLELDEKIKQLPLVKAERVLRYKYNNASEMECDSQGRIILTKEQMNYAKLEDAAFITGVQRRVEIWNKAAYDAYEAAGAESITDLLSEIM